MSRTDSDFNFEIERLQHGLFSVFDDYLLVESSTCNLNEKEFEGQNEYDDLEDLIEQFESILETSLDSSLYSKSVKSIAIPFYNTSLFPNTPSTINFPGPDQHIDFFPREVQPILYWKHSAITPNIVRKCVKDAGFRTTTGDEWIGYFGKHMKASSFKSLAPFQKFNHFPGSFQLGRKDNLWRNLNKLQLKNSRHDFRFLPQTFILPGDYESFKYNWNIQGPETRWIKKPLASARGIGVELIQTLADIPKDKPLIVQRYITNPLLINESKCDLRIYVYVTSFDPLIVYIYKDGVARFATEKYSNSSEDIHNRFIHLTNYSVNKMNPNFHITKDGSKAEGHKWTLTTFWRILQQNGIDTNRIWEEIKSMVLKTIISVDSCINTYVKNKVKCKECCHELFGFDVILDADYKPWLLEVNISPSLHSVSEFDVSLKSPLVANLLTLAGYRVPNNDSPPISLTSNERYKHAYFARKGVQNYSPSKLLATLTPDDIRTLIDTEDELKRCEHFERIFPNDSTEKYLHFFPIQRYYNLLLNAWYKSSYGKTNRGVTFLKSLADDNMHITRSPPKSRVWSPAKGNIFGFKHITMKKYQLSVFTQKRSLSCN
ncbi:Tubulin polyglutamylase TTLL4 isoform X4 [Oopsacas minuta]|uniref:Tubulin polyglutamylase TTLL4 isoform X4 n=1 Tax=Oopsacas minuta TaxID=111878 RepID=A0AAV7K067_9METZ|nr:Tubulin polyglutamylase TTLL4 isoform X4 [Oopsacas minuta]